MPVVSNGTAWPSAAPSVDPTTQAVWLKAAMAK